MRTTPTVRADSSGRRGPAPERLAAELVALGSPFADDAFTSAVLASALGVDVSAARSRLRALIEAGLVEETGRGGPRRDGDGRPIRGRPPTRYRLVSREDAVPEHIATT